MTSEVLQSLKDLSKDLRDLAIGNHVPVISAPVDPLMFYRNFVGPNKPAVIAGAIGHWPALQLWTNDYLVDVLADHQVTVASTPDGYADAIRLQDHKAVFAMPHEAKMPIAQVLQHFGEEASGNNLEQVLYIQAQNNSLQVEFPELLRDVEGELPWATAAFGSPPEATNIWLGNHRSTTSFHRDHYENIYAVVAGTKRFLLLPPSERYRLGMMDVPAARYQPLREGLRLVLEDPERLVSWCPIIAAQGSDGPASGAGHRLADESAFYDADLPQPLEVEVCAGQVLYLPSMWYHQVQQADDPSGRVIAVNYWYDMSFDCKYAYAQLIERLTNMTKDAVQH